MTKPLNINISVILPVYNEAENIENCYNRISNVLCELTNSFELLFVNDGSKDNSLDVISALADKHTEVKYLNLSRNFGQQAAISAGLDYCQGERVVIMDADLQDPPEIIAEMSSLMDKGFDVVYGKEKAVKGNLYSKNSRLECFIVCWHA